MNEKLLNEYQYILREINIIKNRAVIIKNITQDKLKCAKNQKEKENIFNEFKIQLHNIKKDKTIKKKYKNLIKRKEILEDEFLSDKKKIKCESADSISDDITNLINKYKQDISFDNSPKKYTDKCNNNNFTKKKLENEKNNKNLYIESSCSENESINKKKSDVDDTYQVKKLINLIKDLQCEIDN